MDPASNETPGGLQLPAPQTTPGGQTPAAGQPGPGQPMPPMTLPMPPAMPQQSQPGAVPAAGGDEPLPTATVPIVDDGGDLIEKEWVNRAKQIVARTRDDPYKQSEELTVFRADYMKKHFGKTIKQK